MPEVAYAAIWAQTLGKVEYKGVRTQGVAIFGADDRYIEVQGGELLAGRWFTRAELIGGGAVVVLSEGVVHRVFGREDPLGRMVRVGGRPATVVGVYQPPGNIFSPPGQETGGIVPYLMAAVRMYEDGFAGREDIDEGMRLGCGHPMGPLTLCDFIGLDVLYAVCDSLYEEFKRPEYAPPPLLKRMVVSGHHGRKAGRGFYEYS